eukprot:3114662-Rhodomonas_salina.2
MWYDELDGVAARSPVLTSGIVCTRPTGARDDFGAARASTAAGRVLCARYAKPGTEAGYTCTRWARRRRRRRARGRRPTVIKKRRSL